MYRTLGRAHAACTLGCRRIKRSSYSSANAQRLQQVLIVAFKSERGWRTGAVGLP